MINCGTGDMKWIFISSQIVPALPQLAGRYKVRCGGLSLIQRGVALVPY